MVENNFHRYLTNLGYSNEEIQSLLHKNIFSYRPHPQIPSVKYVLVNSNDDIYKEHLQLWNQNSDNVFLAVGSQKTYLINAKVKPNFTDPLKKGICIGSFNYGINSKGYKDVDIEEISKHSISSTYFFKFIQEKQGKNKHEVDKDLLLNLIALRNDLISEKNEHIIHLLILRCLFVKYLEDRGIFEENFLSNALASNSPSKLIKAFNEVCKINGDVFGNSTIPEKDIKDEYLRKLHLFFTTDYRSKQGTLFPYRFDYIPIQLISHVYEAFLKNETKKDKGVYYTPHFVVDFMLSQSLKSKAQENPNITVLDVAVGSGPFLVESFKIIRNAQKRRLNLEEKRYILENQLFGIDIDPEALQITAFSLYLALLEDEDPNFIKDRIAKAHPILPSLISKTLLKANTIVDPVFEGKKFDFIVSNPPWGSVPSGRIEENIAERNAIDNKTGAYPEYQHVANYERSQAFLRRISKWQKEDTITAMIVKNSIFLNDKALNFRKDFLNNNKIDTFFELSHYNKILFKKKPIGKINGKTIEVGASEPCAVVVFRPNYENKNYSIKYISPKLTPFGDHFEIIHYTINDAFNIKKNDLINNDLLWKTLVKGTYEDFLLIKKLQNPNPSQNIICSRGFEASKNMKRTKETPFYRTLIKSEDFDRFFISKNLTRFNWNQKLHRSRTEELFTGDRILIAYRPKRTDKYRLRCIQVSEDCVFRNDILCFKKDKILNHKGLLALLNSSLMGYYIYMISSQWDGGLKREALRTNDIKSFNFDNFDNENIQLYSIVDNIINTKNIKLIFDIDKLILKSISLTDYEKEIINEFYEIHVDRASEKLQKVQGKDMENYFAMFKESFALILSPEHTLNASYKISSNVGAIIKISIVKKDTETRPIVDNALQIMQFVKNKQLNEVDKLFREEKVKIYEPQHFYIIKSNLFKDWTRRQAMKDAKEEIGLLLSKLPDSNG